jgi:hypothetical protein
MTGTVPDLPDLAAQRKTLSSRPNGRRPDLVRPCTGDANTHPRPVDHVFTQAHRATRRPGPPSRPSPCLHGRLPARPRARPSAIWARTSHPGIIQHARQTGVKLPPHLDDPSAELTPQLIVEVIRDVAFHYFPKLAMATEPTG